MADTIVGRMKYLITGDTSFLDASLNQSSKSVQKFGGQVKSSGAMLTKFFTGAALVTAGKKLKDLSVDTSELGNKFNVVFRGAIDDTNAWIDEYTGAVNRGDIATRTYLASLQDIRTGFGDSGPEAAKFSQAVVGVTNDLVSLSNVPFDEASAAIQSGLSGQFEALRRLGVGLNVAIIDQGDYAASIGKTWQEMDNLEKQEAILSGIMQQSKNAIGQSIDDWRDYNYLLGDAAKTADSVANKEKGLAQSAADVGSEFGDTLIPAYSELLDIGGDLLDWLDDMSPAMKSLTVAMVGLGAAFAAGGPIAVGITVLAGLALKARDARDRTDELQEVTTDLVTISGEYRDVTEQLNTNMENLSESERGVLEARQSLLALEMEKKLAEYSREYQKYNRQLDREADSTGTLEARLRGLLLIQEDRNKAEERFFELNQKKIDGQLNNEEAEEYTTILENASKNQRRLSRLIEETNGELAEQKAEFTQVGIVGEESILQFAKAYKDGLINIETYKTTNRELYDEIIRVAEGLKEVNKELDEDAEEKAKAWQEYLQAILDAKEGDTGAMAARAFIDQFDREIEADKTIYEALNGNIKEWDPTNLLEMKASGVKAAIAEMLAIDPEEIDEAFTTEDQSVQILLDSLRETEVALDELNKTADEKNKDSERSISLAEEYAGKLNDLRRTEEQQIEHERSLALARAWRAAEDEEYNGDLIDDLAAINDYYDELIEAQKEGAEAQEAWGWQDWASNGLSSIASLANAVSGLYNAIADKQIQALEAQMNAELAAMGLLDEEDKNRYTDQRQKAQRELADLQNDLRKAKTLEEKNELEKQAAEKAVEVDELIQQEEQEEQKLAIEEKYARKKAQLEYDAAMQSWKLQRIAAIAAGAQAVLSALSTSGNIYAAIAMSAKAATLSGLQIATIEMSKPVPPSFAVGVWDVPEDMNANIHKGETILPKPFADEFRENVASGGGVTINLEVYTTGNDTATIEESTSEDITTLRVFTKGVVREMFQTGEMNLVVTKQFRTSVRGL